MVDLEVLKARGIDAEGLKKHFNVPREKRSKEVAALLERIRARIQGGRDHNLETYQVYWAMDQAWDSCFKQITPTLLAAMQDKEITETELNEVLRQWNLDPKEVITEIPDNKSPGKTIKRINAPAFTRIVVPLVVAYIKIRWARLSNDRRMVPLFKYDPVISDQYSRLKCDALTHNIEMQARQMGYFETLKQAIFRMLLYGSCIKFPVEEWYQECQEVEAASPFPAEGEEMSIPVEGGESLKIKKVIVKEGIRYHMPHSTRTYRDHSHNPSTMNTDTGVEYGGYWKIMKWGQVVSNKDFYNLDIVGYGNFNEWFQRHRQHSYWANTLRGGALEFPGSVTTKPGGSLDAESHVSDWYSKDWSDKPIIITEHYEKLIPKDFGLGDYEYPVWFRFVIAADDTPLYVAPVGYCPLIWYGYDYAEGRTHNASMALEVLPFQDQFTNLMTQLLLTTRQNLANITFVNSDLVNQKDIDKINNWGERIYRSVLNLVPISFQKFLVKQQSDPRMAVISHKFPVGDTTALINSMNIILDTLERVLVMSSQEVGQAASHEQTREEVRNISQNTSTRVTFTAIGIDSAVDAWKKQLYAAKMAYGAPSFWAQVPMDQPIDKEVLEKLGFTYAAPYNKTDRKAHVLVKNKSALAYESFASNRDGQDRVDDVATATAMNQFLKETIANPDLFAALGVEQIIQVLNQIAKFAGFPRDFKLINTGQTEGQQQQIMGAMQEMAQALQEQIAKSQEDIQGALGAITEKNVQQDQSLQQLAQRINGFLNEAEKIQTPEIPDMDDMQPV
jgi:hypothetical protein